MILVKYVLLQTFMRVEYLNASNLMLISPKLIRGFRDVYTFISIQQFYGLFDDLKSAPEMVDLLSIHNTLEECGQQFLQYEIDYYVYDDFAHFYVSSRNQQVRELIEQAQRRQREPDASRVSLAIRSAKHVAEAQKDAVLMECDHTVDYDCAAKGLLVNSNRMDIAVRGLVAAASGAYVHRKTPLGGRLAFSAGKYCFYHRDGRAVAAGPRPLRVEMPDVEQPD